MENNLIYALYCPITNQAVYVGQSSIGLNRPFAHIKEKSHNIKVNEWINYLRLNGKEPILIVLENYFDKTFLNDKEQYWINKFLCEGNILLNQKSVSPAFYTVTEFDKEDNNDFLYNIRMYVKGRRKLLKLTQTQLSKKSNIGLRFIREFEQGKKDNFNTKTIYNLIKFLGRVNLNIELIKT